MGILSYGAAFLIVYFLFWPSLHSLFSTFLLHALPTFILLDIIGSQRSGGAVNRESSAVQGQFNCPVICVPKLGAFQLIRKLKFPRATRNKGNKTTMQQQ
jgi:hypothetical protein